MMYYWIQIVPDASQEAFSRFPSQHHVSPGFLLMYLEPETTLPNIKVNMQTNKMIYRRRIHISINEFTSAGI